MWRSCENLQCSLVHAGVRRTTVFNVSPSPPILGAAVASYIIVVADLVNPLCRLSSLLPNRVLMGFQTVV